MKRIRLTKNEKRMMRTLEDWKPWQTITSAVEDALCNIPTRFSPWWFLTVILLCVTKSAITVENQPTKFRVWDSKNCDILFNENSEWKPLSGIIFSYFCFPLIKFFFFFLNFFRINLLNNWYINFFLFFREIDTLVIQ